MNSSGIKRGLAASAISALAIAGLPLFASAPANAATGDILSIVSVGPVRNDGDQGLQIQAKIKNITTANVKVADSSLQDLNPDTVDQRIGDVVPAKGISVPNGSDLDSDPNDNLDEYIFFVDDVFTTNVGDTYKFAIFEDEADATAVNDTEARAQVTGVTSGAPTRVVAAPTYQTAPVDTDSDDYELTLRDAAGRVTQLDGSEEIRLSETSGAGNVTFTTADATSGDSPILASDVGSDGKIAFVAQSDAEGLHVLRAGAYSDNADLSENYGVSVNLDVSGTNATDESIAPSQVDLVTGADNRDGFGNDGLDADEAQLRQDQTSITVAIKNLAEKNNIVSLTASSMDVTFGGKDEQTQTVTLNDKGIGQVTFTVDAGSIQTGDQLVIDSAAFLHGNGANEFDGGLTLTYNSASLAAADGADVDADQTTYISKYGGTVSPTVTVLDQYGNPATNAYVTYQITSGPNAMTAESARVKTDANGQVTFSITDTKATALNNGDGDLTFNVYASQFAPSVINSDSGSTIVYTADGQGADFVVTVDGQTPGGAVYNPTVVPLTDAVADGFRPDGVTVEDDSATLALAGGTTGASVTVTADNGVLILKDGDTLADGVSSVTGTVGDTFKLVGTTEGTANITVVSGGRTKTATLKVAAAANNAYTARNIALEGPDGAIAGDVVDFTATVSDAFGNPVTGFDVDAIDERITGPGNEQGNSGDSDADGVITYSVEITQGAQNPVTLRLDADDVAQFGAAADRLTAAATTDNAPGLTESVDQASATVQVTDLEALKAAVAKAEADLASAQADLAAAQGNLDVAQTELAVAQGNVDSLQAKKAELRKKLNKAKANDNKQKAKTTRKKLRAVKRNLREAQDNLTIATSKVAAAQNVVDLAQVAVDKAEEALAAAQADLDEAQN